LQFGVHKIPFLEFSPTIKSAAIAIADLGRKMKEARTVRKVRRLKLVAFHRRQPAAVAYLEQSLGQEVMPDVDLGDKSYRALLQGLESLSDASTTWPEGFDVGVAFAIRDIGKTFKRGINRVSFTLNHRTKPVTATLDARKFRKLRTRLAEPETRIYHR
jgi:hypothetical protein